MAEVAKLMADAGVVAIVSLVSPYREHRDAARASHEADGLPFLEIFMDTPLEECEARDPRACMPRRAPARSRSSPAISAPYEAPRPA